MKSQRKMEIFECLSFVEFLFGPMPAIFFFLNCSSNWNLKEVGNEYYFQIKRQTNSQIFPVFAPPLPVALALEREFATHYSTGSVEKV